VFFTFIIWLNWNDSWSFENTFKRLYLFDDYTEEYSYLTTVNSQNVSNKSIEPHRTSIQILTNSTFQSITTRNIYKERIKDPANDWTNLDDRTFFRRNGLYFVNKGFIVFFYVGPNLNSFNCSQIDLQINYKNEVKIKTIQIIKVTYSSIYSFLNFTQLLNLFSLPSTYGDVLKSHHHLQVKASIKDLCLNKSAELSLNLKLKLWDSHENEEEEETITLCSKLFYFNSQDHLENFKTWTKIHKEIGYKSIQIYYFPMKNLNLDEQFDEFVKSFGSNFVQVVHLKYIPNWYQTSQTNFTLYYADYAELFSNINTKSIYYVNLDTINEMLINECYLNNQNKYKFIASYDFDEVILPRPISQNKTAFAFYKEALLKSNILSKDSVCSKHEKDESGSVQESQIVRHLKEIKSFYKHKSHSFYFHPTLYLPNYLIGQFCQELEVNKSQLDSFEFTNNGLYSVHLSQKNELRNELVDQKAYYENEFSISIRSEDELHYSQKLCQLYTSISEKMKFRSTKLQNNIFNRFFFYLDWRWGKSIHRTNETVIISTHLESMKIHFTPEGFSLYFANQIYINQTLSFFSHFRRYHFLGYKEGREIKASQIVFDHYHWNCIDSF
jgi:hypothetical protein